MNFLMVAISLLFVGCTILDALMGGTIAFASTRLTSDLAEGATIAYVESTKDFPSSMSSTNSGVFIGKEYIGYTGKTDTAFSGLQRGKKYGTEVTKDVLHSAGSMVYSEESSHLNSLLGFKVITSETIWGKMFAIGEFVVAWAVALPAFLMWNYDFLDSVSIVKPFLWCISIGVVVVFALYLKKLISPFGS